MIYAIICGSWLRKEQGEPALNFNTWQKTRDLLEVVQTLGEQEQLGLTVGKLSVTWKGLAQTPWNKGAGYFYI